MTTSAQSLTVLLVEDNPNDARLIEKYLREADTAFLPTEIEIHQEQTLDTARERLAEGDIDLLLLDLGLRKSSGIETFERIKADTREIPVIVLTGLQDEQAAVDLLQQGAQDYLNKGSLDRERLVKSLRYALERQEREAELKRTSEQLEVLNRILRHDLKNDIQVLTTWIETLAVEIDEEENEYLENILTTIDHMQELTENSKDFMQLVAGDDDDIVLEPIRIHDLLAVELEKARSSYPDAEFSLDSDLVSATVMANEMLSSAFRNILNNAVQHCDKPTPRVDVVMTRRDDTALITIADNGPGVPDEQKEEIFGKGQRGTDSTGTGIGLYLVHALVTQFGGDVWVEDRKTSETRRSLGEDDDVAGSVFCIELDIYQT
jgi:signal transduction histidine kinase